MMEWWNGGRGGLSQRAQRGGAGAPIRNEELGIRNWRGAIQDHDWGGEEGAPAYAKATAWHAGAPIRNGEGGRFAQGDRGGEALRAN